MQGPETRLGLGVLAPSETLDMDYLLQPFLQRYHSGFLRKETQTQTGDEAS